MSSVHSLIGSWRLISFHVELQDSKERQYQYGKNPTGRLILTPEGYMAAIAVAEGRKAGNGDANEAALMRTMIAYTGKFHTEGNRFVTEVDSSWNEAWTGTNQERYFELKDNQLDIITAWQKHPVIPESPPVRGILSWRRET